MGAWGFKPEDNDGAWDIYGYALALSVKQIEKSFVKKKVDDWTRWERVGALNLILESDEWVKVEFKPSTFKTALEDMKAIRDNGDFLKGWKHPLRVKKAIRKNVEHLTELCVEAEMGRYKIRKKS